MFILMYLVLEPLCFLYLDMFSYFKFGYFLTIIYSNIFQFPSLYLHTLWDPNNTNIGKLNVIQKISYSFFNVSSLCCFDWLFYIPYHLVCYSFLPVCFLFQLWIIYFWMGLLIHFLVYLKDLPCLHKLFSYFSYHFYYQCLLPMNHLSGNFLKISVPFFFSGIFPSSFN